MSEKQGRMRVGVRSPEPVVAAGLLALLQKHADRVQVVRSAPPDVLVYDVLALREDGEEPLVSVLAHPRVVVLAVERESHPQLLARALALGVVGSVSLRVTGEELVARVEAAAREGAVGPRPVARLGTEVGLSEREVAVLTLIVHGRTNQQIADELYLSVNSVKTYVRQAYRKIQVERRSQAVTWAVQHGFPITGVAPPVRRTPVRISAGRVQPRLPEPRGRPT